MTDLTKLTTPFGLLDKKTQDALRAWPHGLEVFGLDGQWLGPVSVPRILHMSQTFRACPALPVPDHIDWSHVAPEWRWMARDEDNSTRLFERKPCAIGDDWSSTYGRYIFANVFASYRRGTVAWQDSLVERPV